MTPKQFLQIGGVVLVLVGLLGFFGIIGPTADKSIFGDAWWFDTGENWAHTLFGVVALLAVFAFPASTHKPLTMLVGVLALLVALWNIFSETLLGTTLQMPADLILHVVVGVWALWASMGKGGMMKSTPPMTPPTPPAAPQA